MQRSQLSCYLTENQQATSSEKKVSPLFHFTKDLKHWNYLSGTQRTGTSILHPQLPNEAFFAKTFCNV